jgi:hypothetical protein
LPDTCHFDAGGHSRECSGNASNIIDFVDLLTKNTFLKRLRLGNGQTKISVEAEAAALVAALRRSIGLEEWNARIDDDAQRRVAECVLRLNKAIQRRKNKV